MQLCLSPRNVIMIYYGEAVPLVDLTSFVDGQVLQLTIIGWIADIITDILILGCNNILLFFFGLVTVRLSRAKNL
jgi:hypothetical protein